MTRLGCLQFPINANPQTNAACIAELIDAAAKDGAELLLLPELHETTYFCQRPDPSFFAQAKPLHGHPGLSFYQRLALQHSIALVISLFERRGVQYHNSAITILADGKIAGIYRKTHLPDGPGYCEKYYFTPGRAAPKALPTPAGRIGLGICWDQWFPEVARLLMLDGADFLAFPSAIGAEPACPNEDTMQRWRLVMRGHAVANVVPILAANRIGDESGLEFYGSSFICDQHGHIRQSLGRQETGYILEDFDLEQIALERASWGFFRDRRPDLYGPLCK